MNPDQLLCEYQENPIGVAHDSPRLSWQCTTSNPGSCQTAYRVQIEDLWDTGKVTSPKAMHVIYSGEPLVSNRLYRWRVCFWDQNDQATPWSSWATFHTGFMSPDDWQARWIKSPANRIESTPSMLAAAHWIWAVPEGSSPLPAALGSCTFAKSFELKSDDASATILLAADHIKRNLSILAS